MWWSTSRILKCGDCLEEKHFCSSLGCNLNSCFFCGTFLLERMTDRQTDSLGLSTQQTYSQKWPKWAVRSWKASDNTCCCWLIKWQLPNTFKISLMRTVGSVTYCDFFRWCILEYGDIWKSCITTNQYFTNISDTKGLYDFRFYIATNLLKTYRFFGVISKNI